MNENIKAGAEIHEGGGYSEGTQEAYEAFAKVRNQSLAKARIERLAEQATDVVEVVNPDTGITHHREFFDQEKFAELIVRECASRCLLTPLDHIMGGEAFSTRIKRHFGVE
jgi:hypothetical protein